jgi:serine/threonine protein kinase/tetratricopeptide (TPR) repeat protein
VSHSVSESNWVPGSILLGEFRIERVLGHGGFGDVVLVQSIRSSERYAAKLVRAVDLVAQGHFLTEAQRWLTLPEHLHINTCRFIRTVNRKLVIFSDYVDAGSLADWISSRRLYDGGVSGVTARLVDIAMQIACGLEAALGAGLLHLDIKPSNVLLRRDGIAQITDFGMATTGDVKAAIDVEAVVDYIAGPAEDADDLNVMKASIRNELFYRGKAPVPQAIAEGLSLVYAAPEQAEGRPVGPGADTWSWAVTVLEMFVGERTWRSGPLAGATLEQVLATGATVVRIPPRLAEMLTAALRSDPTKRPLWQTIVDELADICARVRPPMTSTTSVTRAAVVRRLASGTRWSDPRDHLTEAYKLAGLDFGAGAPYFPRQIGTRRARAMEDLRTLWQARTVLDGTPDSARVRWARMYVCYDMAVVAELIGDLAGATNYYEEAAHALGEPDDTTTCLALIAILTGQAITLRKSYRWKDAVEHCERAISLAQLVKDDRERHRTLANAVLTKANCTTDYEASLAIYDRAAESARRAEDAQGEAKSVAGKASRLAAIGRHSEAELLFRQAEQQLGALAEDGRRPDIAAALAQILLNQALLVPDIERQVEYATEAARRLSELVDGAGWHELADNLGEAYFAVGRGQERQDRPQEALDAYRRARKFFEQAVVRDGRTNMTGRLADCFGHESTLVRELENPAAAVEVAREAVMLWQQLAQVDGEEVWRRDLAMARQKLGAALSAAGDMAAAIDEYQETLRSLDVGDGKLVDPGLAAVVNHGIGVVSRMSRRPNEAVEWYRRGLDLLAGEPDGHHEVRALLLESLGDALGDLNQHRNALNAFYASANVYAEQAQSRLSDVAISHRRIVNALLELGEYGTARQVAEETLRLFDDLLARGRWDLATEANRLRGAHGVILTRLLDLDGAAESITRARDHCRLSPIGDNAKDIAAGFDALLGRIDELRTATAGDAPAMVSEIRSSMARAAEISRAGQPDFASKILEDALDELRWLSNLLNTEEVIALCGQAGLQVGVTAMYCGRDAAAYRGFAVSVQCHETLLENHRTGEYIKAWFHGHVGMASVCLVAGDEQGSEKVVTDMDAHLVILDPSHRAQWTARARDILSGCAARSKRPE